MNIVEIWNIILTWLTYIGYAALIFFGVLLIAGLFKLISVCFGVFFKCLGYILISVFGVLVVCYMLGLL